MKRSKFNLSHYNLLTCDMGELVPVSCTEVLPGDSLQAHTSLLLRVSPLVAPVMHPVQVRVHHWFVPYRILWDGWENFITGGPDGMDDSTLPVVNSGPTGFQEKGVLDYLGVPPNVPNIDVVAFPLMAYNKIYNEFYRDQDLIAEADWHYGSLHRIAWEKDYFAAARPWPQKGPEITVPMGTFAPVVLDRTEAGTATVKAVLSNTGADASGSMGVGAGGWVQANANGIQFNPNGTLFADLSQATGADINDVRKAFALQRYAEARARYGSRYTEYLRYLGVRSSDARLQRPEYLGGGKTTISFSEVLKTGSGEDPTVPLGSMVGHGISALRSRRYRRFFEEHGVVVSLLSVRPRAMYTQGLHKQWLRKTKEDFWQKELEHIGQQEVLTQEVYAGATPGEIFGFSDRYAEYRSCPNRISAEFRDIMDYWHLGRNFSATPVLNASFVNCDPSKRIYAEQTQNSLWIMAQNNIVARRLVSGSAAPRLY